MALLILNAGSSTLKVALTDASGNRIAAWGNGGSRTIEATSGTDYRSAIQRLAKELRIFVDSEPKLGRIDGVVHRIVHGGTQFTDAVVVDPDVRASLAKVTELAPLHNPPGLAVLDAAMAALPDVPHVAVFDTGFHATLSRDAYTYPLPFQWTDRWSLRRFGFHGPSHAYCAERAASMLARPIQGLATIVAHLGNGASVTAISDGRSVDTTMGFTPLEGLMMGTRTGSVDPGLLLHLLLQRGMSAEDLHEAINQKSGLLGVSGVSADMRDVIQAADAGNERAALAVAMFVRRARAAIGALAVTLGRADALVFTAGIGEHSATIRSAICEGLQCLGLEIDAELNAHAEPDAIVSTSTSRGAIMVVTTREDVILARAATACLEARSRA